MTNYEMVQILQAMLDSDIKNKVPDTWPIPISKATLRKIVELLKG